MKEKEVEAANLGDTVQKSACGRQERKSVCGELGVGVGVIFSHDTSFCLS